MKARSLVLLFAAFATLACEQKPRSEPREPEPTILIGSVLPLTGSLAALGITAHNGFELAVNEANAAGGVRGMKIVLRTYDDQGKPEEAANAITRLLAQDGAQLILGEIVSSNSLAMASRAQNAHVPMICMSTNPKVTEVGDYVFRVLFTDTFQGSALARLAKERLERTRVAVLTDQRSDYSIGLSETFIERFTAAGGKIVAHEFYLQGDSDFRAPLTAVRAANPDAVFIPGYYAEVAMIARQTRELGIRATLLGGTGWTAKALIDLGGEALEGSYFTTNFSHDNPRPEVQVFVAKYKQVFREPPDAIAAAAYVAARVAIDSMGRAHDLSGPALKEAITKTKDFAGPTGIISFDEKRNPATPAVVMKIVGGKATFVTIIER